MNVLLADHAHRVVNIPARSIKSIIGVEHQELPEDKAGSKSIIRYDYGAGPMFAWLRTPADQVMARINERTADMPEAWIALRTAKGDSIHLLSASIIATHGVDPEEFEGGNTRIDFDSVGNGREIKFAVVVETPEMIEEARSVVEESIRAATAPAAPQPAPKPRRARKPSK